MLPRVGWERSKHKGGRAMPYEIREPRLLIEHHALSGYVPMLAPTHTYLCMQLQAPLACACIHMYTCTIQLDIHLYRHTQVTHAYRRKNQLRFGYFGSGLPRSPSEKKHLKTCRVIELGSVASLMLLCLVGLGFGEELV